MTLYQFNQLHYARACPRIQRGHVPSPISRSKDHGRGETRTVRGCQHLHWLDACADWAGLRTLVLVETERHTSQGVSSSQRFYMSSLADPDPATYARLVRGHWAIENLFHWQIDVTFKEDQCRLRTGDAALNANILRKTALYVLTQDPQAISIKRKRKQAAYNNEYLHQLLHKA